MKILQHPISSDHKSAFFFNGVIAEANGFKLETFQDGEITYDDDLYIGEAILRLAEDDVIGDPDVEDDGSPCVQILVDKFIAVTLDGKPVDDEAFIYDNYDDAIEGFKKFE